MGLVWWLNSVFGIGVLVYSAHASSLRLRSARARFARRPVGLASALHASEGSSSSTVVPVKTEVHSR